MKVGEFGLWIPEFSQPVELFGCSQAVLATCKEQVGVKMGILIGEFNDEEILKFRKRYSGFFCIISNKISRLRFCFVAH